MPCADCFTIDPEPFETDQGMAFWFLVENNSSTVSGIEANGEIGFNFAVSMERVHPDLEEGQEALCDKCFCARFPVNDGI